MRCPLSTGPGEKEVEVTAKQVYQRLDGPQNWEEPTYSRDFLYEIITTVVIDNVSVIWRGSLGDCLVISTAGVG